MVVVLGYILRLAFLQLIPNDYEEIAWNNALYRKVIYPMRGVIYDRNGRLLVFNQPAYDVMVIMREVSNLDTLDLCNTLHISRQTFEERIKTIQNKDKNPGYSA